MDKEKMNNLLLEEERISYKQALIRSKQELKEKKLAKKRALIRKKRLLKENKLAQKRVSIEKSQFLKREKRTLKNKLKGKSYDLSDFDLHFKRSPKYQNEFREVEAKYSYRNQTVIYYLFVRKDLNNQEALESAKNQIKNLIRTGEIRRYAKYFCRSVY